LPTNEPCHEVGFFLNKLKKLFIFCLPPTQEKNLGLEDSMEIVFYELLTEDGKKRFHFSRRIGLFMGGDLYLEAISKMPQQDNDAPKLDQGQEIFKMVLVAHHQPPEVLQPGEKTFNFPASSIPPKHSSVLCLGPLSTSTMWGDHLGSPILTNLIIQPIAIVGFVSDQPGGHFVGKAGIKGLLDQSHFMRRSAGHVHGDRKTRSVCHCHDLAAFAPLGLAHGSAPFLRGRTSRQ
jgi:hypothetical protein